MKIRHYFIVSFGQLIQKTTTVPYHQLMMTNHRLYVLEKKDKETKINNR